MRSNRPLASTFNSPRARSGRLCVRQNGCHDRASGRIEASGRIAERAVTSALGWRGGDRLTLTAEAGVMTARRDPGGMVTVPARPYIVIPAALRSRCGLRAGDHVLLAASPGEDMLAAYSFAVVDQAMRAHALVSGEGRLP